MSGLQTEGANVEHTSAVQQYNLRKKGEHAFKSLVMNSKTISVVDPESYAERFCKSARDLFVARGADLEIKMNVKPKS